MCGAVNELDDCVWWFNQWFAEDWESVGISDYKFWLNFLTSIEESKNLVEMKLEELQALLEACEIGLEQRN